MKTLPGNAAATQPPRPGRLHITAAPVCLPANKTFLKREFIRNDVGDEAGRVFVKQKPIIAQEIVSGQRNCRSTA